MSIDEATEMRPTQGFVLDDLALAAGLVGLGSERQRQTVSRVISKASSGGLPLSIPALCLAWGRHIGPGVVEHVAMLVTDADPEKITVSELRRKDDLDRIIAAHPELDWAGLHAAWVSETHDYTIMTTDAKRYEDRLDVLLL